MGTVAWPNHKLASSPNPKITFVIVIVPRAVMVGKVIVKSAVESRPLIAPPPVYVRPLPNIHCAVVPDFNVVSAYGILPASRVRWRADNQPVRTSDARTPHTT